jgi:hypothetical protein
MEVVLSEGSHDAESGNIDPLFDFIISGGSIVTCETATGFISGISEQFIGRPSNCSCCPFVKTAGT